MLAPRGRESEYGEIRTQTGELLPESRVVVPNEMAEEVTTGGLPDGCDVITRMTEMEAIANDDVIIRPRLLSVEVMEEIDTDEITLEEYTDGQLVKNETTKLGVSTELVDLPQKWMTRGFLELAEEARLVDVRLTPSCCMNDIIQQITERKEPMSKDISWKIEEVMEQSVDSFCDVAMKVPTAKFVIGQLMQWPNGKSTGMMICEFTLESEMFYHGPVRREAEPVFVAAESEVFTPVFTGGGGGGGFVAETGPLVVAEAVTSRVSALPTVGSDIHTGLSTAVGGEDWCSLSSGDYLDNVRHVAGRSEARTVPVEHLLLFSAVYIVMPSWMRPLVVQTSKFFISDEREEVEMPICEKEDRPVRTRKLYIHDVDMGAQRTKETHGVGPTGDRWDGLDMMDDWYMGCIWMKTQPGDTERLLRGSPCSGDFGNETGPVARNGQSVLDLDCLDGHPNRRGGSVKTGTDVTIAQYGRDIKGLLSKDWTLSDRPAVWKCAPVYPLILVICSDRTLTVLYCGVVFKSLAVRLEMSSGSFLKSVLESNLDKLYDLPEGIQDVMGLQALRPSAAVCKVMTIPDSNCIRIVTPDEHVPTGFHEILIYVMGLEEWPKVPLSEIGCLRLDWPKELFNFVGRYQLELEQMRKECRDRFEGISSGACPTCEKFIQVNLGRHVALYHLDLAQLWRCPVGWCPVWKGTSQDCIDHMCRAHNTPMSVKAGNLARWFPPWTVTREQWHSMSRPSVSVIAIDTFLFSRIGTPLFHRYRVFDRLGSHPAFRKPYMPKLFPFLKESDSESIRRSHRRREKEIAVSMSRQTLVTRNVVSETMLSGPAPQRTVVSKLTGRNAGQSLVPPAGGTTGSSVVSINGHTREEDTVQALMDLSLPRFARLEDGGLPKTRLWPITEQPPSSPASIRDGNRSRTPSPCYQLDDISSASSTGETTTNDYKLTLPTESPHSITPVGSIVLFSDNDVPLCSGQEDRRKVKKRDVDEDGPPGPNEVLEYVPIPRKKPVDVPMDTPTPRDRPVEVPIMRVRPADDRMYDPMLGEWPVEDRICEANTLMKPAGGQTLRASPVETLVYKYQGIYLVGRNLMD